MLSLEATAKKPKEMLEKMGLSESAAGRANFFGGRVKSLEHLY